MRVLVTVFHLQISSEVSADTLHNLFNDILKNGNFPDNLNLDDITPVSKKKITKTSPSYLSNRWYRTKINKQFSSWQELIQGVPQGSVLDPVLFNIYLNEMFYIAESTNVCNFADDTTFYACNGDVNSLINRLEHDSYIAMI